MPCLVALGRWTGLKALVAHHVERQHRFACDRLGERRLAVAGGSVEQHAASGLEAMASQQVDPSVLFDEFFDGPPNGWLELKRLETAPRYDVQDEIVDARGGLVTRQQVRRSNRRDDLREPVSN